MHKLLLSASAALCFLATSASAQVSKNATLLGTFRQTNGAANDVWGFEGMNGKPYCVLCTTSGTHILDVSNPAAPRETGYFAASLANWGTSSWRDAKYWKGYVYVVTEARGGGVQIIDCRNPDAPTGGQRYKPSGVSWDNTHNIAIDFKTGYLYCCGSRGGMHILDPNTNPTSPRFVATWRSPYIHDLDIRDGYAHVSYIYSNDYAILDVRNLPTITEVGRARAPGTQYCHNNWVTADNQYSVTTNESAGGPIGIWDVRNFATPKLIASYRANNSSTAIPHNAYILDYVIHASHYTEGYRAVDMSTPTNPVEVGFYDTYSGASSGYNGNWGCYPYARSGIMYVSDRSTGLYLVKPLASAVRYGDGTAGSSGALPHVHLKGAAWIGNSSFGIGVRDGLANSAAVMAIGGKRANLVAGGVQILVDLVSPAPLLLVAPTNANGSASVSIPLPNDNNLVGNKINLQAFIVDSGASALGLSASEGLEFEIFRN